MLDVFTSGNGIVVVRVNEVPMVRQPAEGEYSYDDDEHSHHLSKSKILIVF